MAAHQRESSTCIPAPGKNEPKVVKDAEVALAAVIEEGRVLAASGSFEDQERNAAERKEAEAAVKRARAESKADKRAIKELAASSMSAASWTQSVAAVIGGGDDARFAKAEDGTVEHRLAAETVGLVSAEAFRERREALEAEEATKREREAEEEAEAAKRRLEKKKEKKRKREQQERRGLSFVEDD